MDRASVGVRDGNCIVERRVPFSLALHHLFFLFFTLFVFFWFGRKGGGRRRMIMRLMYLYFFMKPTVDSTFMKPNYESYTKSPPLFFKLLVPLSVISQPPNHRTLNLFSCFLVYNANFVLVTISTESLSQNHSDSLSTIFSNRTFNLLLLFYFLICRLE